MNDDSITEKLCEYILKWLNVVHYSSLFQYFVSINHGPCSDWFLYTCCYGIGELTNTTSKERNGTAHSSYLNYHLTRKYPLGFIFSYVQPSSTNRQLFEKHLCNLISHYDNYGRFCYERNSSCTYHQINAFHCQQRWMVHKGGYW